MLKECIAEAFFKLPQHIIKEREKDSWIQLCNQLLVSQNFVDDLYLTLMSTHFQFQEENWDSECLKYHFLTLWSGK